MPSPGSRQWFENEHAVDWSVAKARGYHRWKTGDEFKSFTANVLGMTGTFRHNIAAQSPQGVIIPRSLGGKRDPVLGVYTPEFRPDVAVRTKGNLRFWHTHPTLAATTKSGNPKWPRDGIGRPLPPSAVHLAEHMSRHIARDKHPGDHAGVNVEVPHAHLGDPGKYLFVPGPGAKAFDVHPFMLERLGTCKRLFVGMEGCIKGDSMTTEVLSSDEFSDTAVISCASVTLHHAPLFEYFAACLLWGVEHHPDIASIQRRTQEVQVFLVPDADAFSKDEVRHQCMLFSMRMAQYFPNTFVAAPPPCTPGFGMHDNCLAGDKCKANGVDDFRAFGASLLDMRVLHRSFPTEAFNEWYARRAVEKNKRGRWQEGLAAEANLLSGMIWCADPDHKYRGHISALARVGRGSRSKVYEAAHRLIACGAITPDRPLDLIQRQYKRKDGTWITPFDFEDPPEFTLAPRLACPPDYFRLLKEIPPMLTLEDRVARLEESDARRTALEETDDQEILDDMLSDEQRHQDRPA
ncbi:MAG: hypothetical protein H0X39_05820 [Actinobacteria bacterium]|nr:hypothetical protein [Actinomycetota bacterium]